MNYPELVERLDALKVPRTSYSFRENNLAYVRKHGGYSLEFLRRLNQWGLFYYEPKKNFWARRERKCINSFLTECAAFEMLFRNLVKDKRVWLTLGDERGMTCDELRIKLLEAGYRLRECRFSDNSLFLTESGPFDGIYSLECSYRTKTWRIGYKERGLSKIVHLFYSEPTACEEFYGIVTANLVGRFAF